MTGCVCFVATKSTRGKLGGIDKVLYHFYMLTNPGTTFFAETKSVYGKLEGIGIVCCVSFPKQCGFWRFFYRGWRK